ncbi:MAG: DnaA/Hda family protein [Elusimicrobia bacterium]|nr:DnaA/Hda family protein [Elusimicrobiota bacterium]
MVELWSVQASPTAADPRRHTLWLKAQLSDVQTLIRRVGAACGRPQRQSGSADYNFLLPLHAADDLVLSRLQEMLRSLAPEGPSPGNGRTDFPSAPAAPMAPVAGTPIPDTGMPALDTGTPALDTGTPSPVSASPAMPELSPSTPPPQAAPAAVAQTPSLAPDLPALPDLSSRTPPPQEAPAPGAPGVFSPFADLMAGGAAATPGGEPTQTPLPSVAPATPFPAFAQTPAPEPSVAASPAMSAPTPLPSMAPATPFPDPAPGPGGGDQTSLPMGAPPPFGQAEAYPDAVKIETGPIQGATFPSLPPAPSIFPGAQVQTPMPFGQATTPAPFGQAAAPEHMDMATPLPGLQPSAPLPGFPAPAAAPAAAAVVPPAPAPETDSGPACGALLELNPALTLESLQVGPFNRFSHAASMSVIANPGAMYNPLFLFGGPGVGKTHLLHAIGKALQDQAPGDSIFMTTGPRLTRAVKRARATNRLGEIEELAKKAKALLIDDAHLLSVDEATQPFLASLVAGFFSSTRQVVMTSVYPPRALGALEEALKFQISAGWSVDMKPLGGEVQKELITPALARAGMQADAATIEALTPRLESGQAVLGCWVERLRSLMELRARNRQPAALADLLPILMTQEGAAAAQAPELKEIEQLLADMPAPAQDPSATAAAVFFPKGKEPYGEYVMRQFHAVMRQNNFAIPLRPVLAQAYDPEQLYGAPFTIGDGCQACGARVALVLGPNPGTGLAGREVELQRAVEHLLEALNMRAGWIPFVRIKENGPYFRAGLDVFTILRGDGG